MSKSSSIPDAIPAELFLSGYSAEIREIAERLRGVVREAVPDAIERVSLRADSELPAMSSAVARGLHHVPTFTGGPAR